MNRYTWDCPPGCHVNEVFLHIFDQACNLSFLTLSGLSAMLVHHADTGRLCFCRVRFDLLWPLFRLGPITSAH